jgi:hypothetical protein
MADPSTSGGLKRPAKKGHRRNSSLEQGHTAHSNLLVEIYCCEGLADIQMIGTQVRNATN